MPHRERNWTRPLSFVLILVIALFGCTVVYRGALLHVRHTDADVYFRAAWAVRAGQNPYRITDDHGWHYIYPPLLAILMRPLADAPPGFARNGELPYPILIGLWYVLGIVFTLAAVQIIAGAITPANSGRWWSLRFWPLVICLPVLGRSLARGQVGPLWLLLTALFIADALRQKPLRCGLWLAAAVCLKLIPIYLLVYPIWRRSWMTLFGCAIGMVIGLILIPWAALGSSHFADDYRQYIQTMVLPGITGQKIAPQLQRELEDPQDSDSQSFAVVIRNCANLALGTPRSYPPPRFAIIGHWLLAVFLTIGTLLAAGRRRGSILSEALGLSLLTVVMLPIAPICHPHYFILILPLTATLLAALVRPDWGWIILLALIPVSHLLTTLPHANLLRDNGLVDWVVLLIWLASIRLLWKLPRPAPVEESR